MSGTQYRITSRKTIMFISQWPFRFLYDLRSYYITLRPYLSNVLLQIFSFLYSGDLSHVLCWQHVRLIPFCYSRTWYYTLNTKLLCWFSGIGSSQSLYTSVFNQSAQKISLSSFADHTALTLSEAESIFKTLLILAIYQRTKQKYP
jgi:hypothetical protein